MRAPNNILPVTTLGTVVLTPQNKRLDGQWAHEYFSLFITATLSTARSTHNCPIKLSNVGQENVQVLPNLPRLIRPMTSKPVSLTSISSPFQTNHSAVSVRANVVG